MDDSHFEDTLYKEISRSPRSYLEFIYLFDSFDSSGPLLSLPMRSPSGTYQMPFSVPSLPQYPIGLYIGITYPHHSPTHGIASLEKEHELPAFYPSTYARPKRKC